jgi:hypothetical protein
MRGNGYVGELVLPGSINFCYCYLLYVAGPRILETIYPIGWRKSAMKRLVENWRALRGPVGVDEDGEGRWSEEYNSDVVKHAGKKTV